MEKAPEKSGYLLPFGEAGAWERPRGEWWVRLVVLAVAASIFLPNLGAFGLWDPWETHYGEVTRNMVETHDWVSPWWGYRGKIGKKAKQGAPFFSKPILIFWTEASAIKIFGFSEFSIRLPMALLAMLAVFMAYYAMSRIFARRVGLIAAAVLATSPQFFFIARQAQTDMPFVGCMTVALLFFALAVFGPREGASNRRFLTKLGLGLGVLLLSTTIQYGIIATDLYTDKGFESLPGFARIWALAKNNGVYHVALYGVLMTALLAGILVPVIRHRLRHKTFTPDFKDRWIRNTYLMMFYVFCGHASLGKGLLGFMLPGAILFVYILATNRWRALKDLWIVRGVLTFFLVGVPWYLAMFAKHGNAFYARFFIHDHFNRLGTGVHEIDSGTFEHFIRWLGIGLFPWVAFIPLALLGLIGLRLKARDRQSQVRIFLLLWFFVSYLLFTLASTKFHHYIFPALPAMALLIGEGITSFLSRRTVAVRAAVLVGIGVLVAVAVTIRSDPQSFRNLFTYKYDRPMPTHLPLEASASTTKDAPEKCQADADCRPGHGCTEAGTCDQSWDSSQFYRWTTSSVRWLLNQPWLEFEKVTLFFLVLAGLGLLLFVFGRVRLIGLLLVMVVAFSSAAWGLNYYLPSLSPHWSQKYVFEDYYDICGAELQQREVEAYTPFLSRIGLHGVVEYLGATNKRVCPYNLTSWLIVWRGETYYSYNELMPLEKKDLQLRPYLEEINPVMKSLPADCGGGQLLCPNRFYVFMENRSSNSASSVASQVTNICTKVKKGGKEPGKTAYKDFVRWEAKKIHQENDFFTMFEVNPVFRGDEKPGGARCSCGTATLSR